MLYRVSGALFVPCTGLKRAHMVQPSTKSRDSCTYLDIVQRAHKTVCFHQCDPISHFDLPVRLRVALQLTGTAIQACAAAAPPQRHEQACAPRPKTRRCGIAGRQRQLRQPVALSAASSVASVGADAGRGPAAETSLTARPWLGCHPGAATRQR